MGNEYARSKLFEARVLIDLAASERIDHVKETVRLALALEVVMKNPHPEVTYKEQIAIYKSKVLAFIDERDRLMEEHRNNLSKAHVFHDLEETEKPDYYPGR